MSTEPKRRRTKADDAPAVSAMDPNEIVVFESREPEPGTFEVADYAPIRNFSNRRLEWEVPAHDVARFEQHHFVVTGRVVRK